MVTFLRSKRTRVSYTGKLTGRNGLHDLVSLGLVVNLQGEEVLGSSQLELGGGGFLVLLDGDSVSDGEVLLLSSHDLDEFLEVLDFFGLQQK